MWRGSKIYRYLDLFELHDVVVLEVEDLETLVVLEAGEVGDVVEGGE